MYYNKELFVNEKIKTEYARLNKLQTVLILSITLSVCAVALAVIITLAIIYPETFMKGYAIAIFVSVEFIILFSIVLPFSRKLNLLRIQQVEELKGQPIHEKYIELMNLWRKSQKTVDCITYTTVIISVIAVWVLAVIFPNDFNNTYFFIFAMLVCNIVNLSLSKRTSLVKAKEQEILSELNGVDENSAEEAQIMFCEKCNCVTDEINCPSCGNTRLRAVNDEDFCFFVSIDEFYFSMLESALKEKNIEIVGAPYYSFGVTYSTAGRADGRKVYVRYKDIEEVKETYEVLFGENN